MGSIPVKLGRARNRNDARQFLSQYADAAKKMADARCVIPSNVRCSTHSREQQQLFQSG